MRPIKSGPLPAVRPFIGEQTLRARFGRPLPDVSGTGARGPFPAVAPPITLQLAGWWASPYLGRKGAIPRETDWTRGRRRGSSTHRRVLSVLHLDPVVAPASAVGALAVLTDQTLEPHPAGRIEQVRPDLALLEGCDEDALCPPAQELRQVCLAHVQRQPAEVVAVIRQA